VALRAILAIFLLLALYCVPRSSLDYLRHCEEVVCLVSWSVCESVLFSICRKQMKMPKWIVHN